MKEDIKELMERFKKEYKEGKVTYELDSHGVRANLDTLFQSEEFLIQKEALQNLNNKKEK
ncbi:hypothetical protein [Zooshikella sp. RANM57]|uniref:hypothetical protein n=1 Tax=Zooshikella sp. RANM57 TaxID=3425863 RepID=UPI003D6FCA8A